MFQTMTTEHFRQQARAELGRLEHPTVKTLRLQKERIVTEQEKAAWEANAQMEAERLRKEIRELGHEPEV